MLCVVCSPTCTVFFSSISFFLVSFDVRKHSQSGRGLDPSLMLLQDFRFICGYKSRRVGLFSDGLEVSLFGSLEISNSILSLYIDSIRN